MIGREEIAESIRNADALAEEHGDLPAFWRDREVDIEGLTYVAMQRGLRVVMIEKGIDPNQRRPVSVPLTRAETVRQVRYASVFMDGFAAAFNLRTTVPSELLGAMRSIVDYALADEERDYADWLRDEYGSEATEAHDGSPEDGHIVFALRTVATFISTLED